MATMDLCTTFNEKLSLLNEAELGQVLIPKYRKTGWPAPATIIAGTRRSQRHKTSIRSLPVELMNIIFDFVYVDWLLFALHPELYTMQPTSLRSRSWWGLMKLLYQFPYTPSAVCHHWRAIITTTPKFWTRAVVFVDTKDPLSSLATFRSFLKYSQNLPVIVAVVRKSYNVMYDKEEGMNVSLIMSVLLPNLHRFQDIYFHLNQSSSLPSIMKFIQHSRSPTLARLALHCDLDDGENMDNINSSPLATIRGSRSAMTTLKVDGRNLMDICQNPNLWSLILSQLKCLTLERLHPSDLPQRNLSLSSTIEFLGKLPRLKVLTIRDVIFELSPRAQGAPKPEITVSDLILEDLGDGVLKSIFDYATFKPNYMMMRNVLIDELPQIPQPNYLELSEIAIDQDLEDFLCFWDGEVLVIRSCLCFDDSLLAMFQAEISPPFHFMLSPSLQELHIQDCPQFSAHALRTMIEARKSFVMRPENADLGLGFISDVFVCGLGPVLNAEDAAWFRNNLKTFIWSTIQADGSSCHLDPNSCVPFTTL